MRHIGSTAGLDLRQVRRRIRRHRRPLAAAAAFLSVLTLAMALQSPAPDMSSTSTPLPAGYVEMPVMLASSAVAAALSPGDVVDVVAQAPVPSVIAVGAIVTRAAASAGFTSGDGSAIVLALPRSAGLAIAGSDAPLTVLRHQP